MIIQNSHCKVSFYDEKNITLSVFMVTSSLFFFYLNFYPFHVLLLFYLLKKAVDTKQMKMSKDNFGIKILIYMD